MGRPRKYVRPKLRRKCHHCGKMSNNVYVHEVVPSFDFVYDIPPYAGRNKEKTLRADFKGDRKVKIGYYCDQNCYKKSLEVTWEE